MSFDRNDFRLKMTSAAEKRLVADAIEQHRLWLEPDKNGMRFCGAPIPCFINLKWADLRNANLTDANLSCFDLRHTNLVGSNLTNVNLSYANLLSVELDGPELLSVRSFKSAKIPSRLLLWLSPHPRFTEWLPTLSIMSEG